MKYLYPLLWLFVFLSCNDVLPDAEETEGEIEIFPDYKETERTLRSNRPILRQGLANTGGFG